MSSKPLLLAALVATKEAGIFTCFCEIHPTMRGTVEVVE
jgi:plastocyanin